jgi:hypothetical protein
VHRERLRISIYRWPFEEKEFPDFRESGAASVQSRRYHKNLLCAEWAAQWCTERPLLARRLLAKPLPHIPEVSRRVTAAELGADAKLDVAAL